MTKLKLATIGRRNSMGSIMETTKISKKKTVTCLMAVLCIFLWAGASFASWSQTFSEDGLYDTKTYKITKIEVFKLDGTSGLENPGMSNFTGSTWTVAMPNTNYVVATNTKGGGTNNFSWLFSFTGASSDSLHLAYLAYTNSGKVFGQYIDYNYGSTPNWSFPMISNKALTISQIDNPAYNRSSSAVPLPPAVFLFGTGLLSLVGLRKKLKA
jgi:hypothetical protein